MFLFLFLATLVCAPVLAAEICTPPHAVALVYHHVSDETPASTSVSPRVFDQHLAFIANNGFRVMDLSTVVAQLKAGKDLPDSVVVLTFDDGYESVYSEVFPRLKERGWPFTVFICPDAVTRGQGPVMTWDQLREMAAAGVTVASHGFHHGFMNRRRPDEDEQKYLHRLQIELEYAQQRISHETDTSVDLLAYPYGEYSPAVQTMVQKLGLKAVGQQSGAMGPDSDFTCLPRFPMAGTFASLENFGTKISCLPMPTSMTIRIDPNLALEDAVKEAPRLTLVLDMSCLGDANVNAFASGQGSIPWEWVDRESGFLQTQAPNPLPAGRSRYNVTISVPGTGRWYWFSQVWIIGQEHQF